MRNNRAGTGQEWWTALCGVLLINNAKAKKSKGSESKTSQQQRVHGSSRRTLLPSPIPENPGELVCIHTSSYAVQGEE